MSPRLADAWALLTCTSSRVTRQPSRSALHDKHLGHHARQGRSPERDAATRTQRRDASPVCVCGGLGPPEAGMVSPIGTPCRGGVQRISDVGRRVSFGAFLRGAPAEPRRLVHHSPIGRYRLPRHVLRSVRNERRRAGPHTTFRGGRPPGVYWGTTVTTR